MTMNYGIGGAASMTKTGVAISMISLRNFLTSMSISESRQTKVSGKISKVWTEPLDCDKCFDDEQQILIACFMPFVSHTLSSYL